MHFVMSYSGGKDSALALWRLKCQGHQPVALLATYNPEQERSWFHGIPLAILEETAAAMSLPLLPCPCPPADYNASFERALARAKALGTEACAFGDIDIPDHRQWDEERCAAAGLSCLLPLWGEGRAALAREGVEAGFRAVIKLVRLLPGPDAGRGHPGRHRGHRRGYLRGKRGIPHPGHRRPFVPPSPPRAPRPGHPLRHPRRHGFSPAIAKGGCCERDFTPFRNSPNLFRLSKSRQAAGRGRWIATAL